MAKKVKLRDRTEAAIELQGSSDAQKKSTRRHQTNSKWKLIIIVMVTMWCIIFISVGAWFMYSPYEGDVFQVIESIPGLHHHAGSPDVQTSLIAYRSDNTTSIKNWTDVIDEFLKGYRKPGPNHMSCDYDRYPDVDEACWIDIKNIFPCTTENNYNYHKGEPCIFLKFNKIQNWTPEFYNDSSKLPETMPEYLKKHIIEMEKLDKLYLNTIWVSCDGLTSVDKENIGPMEYVPKRGFPGYYFLYLQNTKDYLSPLVAVHFERPARGVVINVECRLWAHNIEYNREKGKGLVQFQLLIE